MKVVTRNSPLKGRVCELALLIIVALLWIPALGPVMRESDQAALVRGAVGLAAGETSYFDAALYNYDKQYVTYWVGALAVKIFGVGGHDEVLSTTNIAAFAILISSLLAYVFGSYHNGTIKAVSLAVYFGSPAIFLSAPLCSSNVVAAGFLIFATVFFVLSVRWLRWMLIPVAVFFAVGARQDVVLCLPFLCWATNREGTFLGLLSSVENWLAFIAALVAVGVGGIISPSGWGGFYPVFFYPKVFLAYTVFGVGIGSILFFVLIGYFTLFGRAKETAGGRSRIYMLIGSFFLVLPFGFYLLQLFSPRHFVVPLTLLLIIGLSPVFGKGGFLEFRVSRLWAVVLGMVTLVPFLVGVRLPELSQPKVTVASPTLYPTTDGHWPMGGYLGFLKRLAKAPTDPVDHNQAVWAAVRDGDPDVWKSEWGDGFWSGCEKLTVLEMPLFQLLALSFELHGISVSTSKQPISGHVFVAEERALLKSTVGHPVLGVRQEKDSGAGLDEQINWGASFSVLTRGFKGWNVLIGGDEKRVGAVVENGLLVRRIALSQFFRGEEFLTEPVERGFWNTKNLEGHRGVLWSTKTFVFQGLPAEMFWSKGDMKIWICPIDLVSDRVTINNSSRHISDLAGKDIFFSWSVFPAFMSIGNL